MNVPAIGQARGIFEIFVPGVFLLMNALGLAYLVTLKYAYNSNFQPIMDAAGFVVKDTGLSIVVIISFGYLIGMLLRLLLTEFPDRISALYCKYLNKKRSRRRGRVEIWAEEKFPYIEWLGQAADRTLAEPAKKFYDDVWRPRKRKKSDNRRFFNHCKTILTDLESPAVAEIMAAESMNRYISGMFYSLMFSCLLIGAAFLFCLPAPQVATLLVVLVFYLVCIVVIASRFRFMRIKEAQIVFDATYRHKEYFCER